MKLIFNKIYRYISDWLKILAIRIALTKVNNLEKVKGCLIGNRGKANKREEGTRESTSVLRL